MLPGFSSKNDQRGGGKNNLKLKRRSHHGDGGDNNNEFNQILLQYNLERMQDQQQYDFDRCEMHRDAYPFATSLSKNTDDESLFDVVDVDDGHDKDDDENQGESSESIEIRICTYQINTSCKLPFIEYLMILSDEKSGKKVFEFPKFDFISSKRKSAEKQAEEHVLNMLMHNEDTAVDDANGHVVKFRGILKHVSISKHDSKKN